MVQIGDLYDFYSFSRFPWSRNIMTPQQEVMEGRQLAEDMWDKIKSIVPKAELYQLRGNHDDRPYKRLLEKCPEFELFGGIDDYYKFDGVNTICSQREELFINDICFIHGYRGRIGDHLKFNHMNTVTGHTHRGGVLYFPIRFETLWELNAGHMTDRTAKPLSYTAQKRISNWTLGYGLIDQWGPRFVSLNFEKTKVKAKSKK